MIEQRTPEWHAQRIGRVTGSIVGAILGLSPYMTRWDAMRAMVRAACGVETEFTGNVATEYGTHHEPGAILDFQFETGMTVTPAPFVKYDDWLGASPDGYVSDGGLIEVKCPYGLRNADVPVPFKAPDEQPHYMAQVQVQMHVTGAPHCHFWQWAPNGTRHDIVDYDPAWIVENIPRLRQFHAEYLDEIKEPGEHLAAKRIEIDTPEAHKMAAEWDQLNEALELAAERKKDLLESMVSLAGERNALIAGRKLTLTERKGAVSYAKAVKDLCPDADLSAYTGKPSRFWGFR